MVMMFVSFMSLFIYEKKKLIYLEIFCWISKMF